MGIEIIPNEKINDAIKEFVNECKNDLVQAEVTYKNLKNYGAYEYESYHLRKEEADICIKALENYIRFIKNLPDSLDS